MDMQRINILSIGRVATDLQQSVPLIREVAMALGIEPHTINGVAHFDARDIARIVEHIRQVSESMLNTRTPMY